MKTTKRQKANCRKLAAVLKRVPARRVHQSRWIVASTERDTLGCALAWAALSGEFAGLQWACRPRGKRGRKGWLTSWRQIANYRRAAFETFPVLDGRVTWWRTVGFTMFGEKAFETVFCGIPLTRGQVIAKLLAIGGRP